MNLYYFTNWRSESKLPAKVFENIYYAGYHTFTGRTVKKPDADAINNAYPDLGLSIMYPHIIPQDIIDLFPMGIINVHFGYLPWNRGRYPNVWPLIDGSQAGVTIHYIDDGTDTGDIIAQRKVDVRPTDTGMSLYRRLDRCAGRLWDETWDSVISRGKKQRTPQNKDDGTLHYAHEFDELCNLDDAQLDYKDATVDILRALTFPPYKNAYVLDNDGRKLYITDIKLEYGDE